MKRFLMLLAVASVAGAMYVAAAPGGLRSAGPTARQFKALSAKVTTLQKEVKQVTKLSKDEGVILVGCLMHQAQAVDRLGTAGSTGYEFGLPGTQAQQTASALDLAPTTETSSQFYFLAVDPTCAPAINGNTGSASNSSTSVQRLLALARARQATSEPSVPVGSH